MILVDAGPLIALMHEDDNEHGRCREAFASINEPLGTVWPATAEQIHVSTFRQFPNAEVPVRVLALNL